MYIQLLDMDYLVKKINNFKTVIEQISLSRLQMLVSQSAKAFKCISKPQLFIVTELSTFRRKLLNEQFLRHDCAFFWRVWSENCLVLLMSAYVR